MPESNSDTPSIVPAAVRTETPQGPPAPPAAPSRGAGITLLGLAWLVLLDAVVETFLAGAPVRWIVGATVAAFLAVSWLVRRRLTLGMHASLSLIVLLGLLAFSAWRPDGTRVGIVMLRQPPATVFAALTTLAILLASWTLGRHSLLPAAFKLAVGLLAAYGLAATVWGVVAATPYPALFHGQSFWTRVPFWLQGAFIGGFVILPAGLLFQAAAAVAGMQGRRRSTDATLAAASALSLAVVVAGFLAPGAAGGIAAPVAGSNRLGSNNGPGLRPLTIASLPLPVARTTDLSHVDPAAFATALGNDPSRIFEFVRDQVAYEAYTGCLRGPRGTLLAMAGNSVDRAALLASLLQHAGQRVRFARGRLPEASAGDLVASMWTDRPRVSPPAPPAEPTADMTLDADTLVSGIKRDGVLLRESLQKAGLPAPGDSMSLESLIAETQDHYWVQWWRDASWVDVDPSFATATPGVAHTRAAETFDALPEPLFHRVDIRVRLEEYTSDKPSTREILHYSAKAADLSGTDLVLTHRPEKGKLTPSLLVGGQQLPGLPFSLKAPEGGGLGGGFGSLFGGGESAAPVPTATAESLEFDFISPGGRKTTAVREIFDLAGAARRRKGETLSASEVAARSEAASRQDFAGAIYDLFVTTGAIHAGHLVNLTVPPRSELEPVDIRAALQRLNIVFSSLSDELLGRIAVGRGSACRFYLDSPRVQIAEVSAGAKGPRLSLDLRRDQARAVGAGFREGQLFYAQVLRGVIDGTLERIVIDHFTRPSTPTDLLWEPTISTSSLFERAQASSATTTVLRPGTGALGDNVPADGRARIEEALAAGYVVVVPNAPIDVGGSPRYAWWQVDPRSGTTTAVTDEGLHQATAEVGIVKNKDGYTVWTSVKGTDMAHAAKFASHREAVSFAEQLSLKIAQKFGMIVEETGLWW
jgi:hypothetical protein